MKVSTILTPLISRRFLGFCISAFICFARPEVAPMIAVLYGALIGAAVSDNIYNNKKKEEKIE